MPKLGLECPENETLTFRDKASRQITSHPLTKVGELNPETEPPVERVRDATGGDFDKGRNPKREFEGQGMVEISELDRIVDQVRAAAHECNTFIVKAALALQSDTVPAVGVDRAAFVGLIRHVKPKIIYVLASPFDAGDDMLTALEEEDESFLDHPSIKKLVTKWRHRDGQTSRVALALMCDGVLHGIVEDADWLGEFETEVEGLAEDIDRAREEREQKAEAAEKGRLAPHIQQLIADPRFSGPKVGVAKRMVLAEMLFPDLDRDTIRAIVERAERDHWLATASR